MKRYHYLYQIENLVNGKIYVGVHSSASMDDDYMGSGYRLRMSISKYGLSNFKKTILRYYNTRKEAFLAESEMVNYEFIAREDTYNLVCGGAGKASEISDSTRDRMRKSHLGKKLTKEHSEKIRQALLGRPRSPEFIKKMTGHLVSDETRDKIRHRHIGLKHTPETIEKIRQIRKAQSAIYRGTKWICCEDTGESRRIPKDDQVPPGWRPGIFRKPKAN